ncbi:MAG: DUF2752 domain-containing protein [Acidimicrobiales bacterium]
MTASWRLRLLGLGGLAAVAGGLVYLYLFDPNQPGHYPACPTRSLFGVDCPGCGAARALHALVHGGVARAIDHNILLVVALPVLVAVGAYWAWGRIVRPVSNSALRAPSRFAWGFFAIAVGFAVLRNLPWAPFTYLASAAS